MIERVKKLSQITSAANVPIVFYGKVVAQFNQPVEGVRIEAAYNKWGILGVATQRPERATNYFPSDASGVFVVKGIKGSSMTIRLEKDGYELAPRSKMTFGFGYGPAEHYEPDPTNPVVYHMWKRQGAAELVGRDFKQTVRADGTPISLDLVDEEYAGFKGWKTVTGSTNFAGPTVRVWREPFFYDPRTSPLETWHYEVTWPGGKVQSTEDVFCYLAPENGYKEKLEISVLKGDPNFRVRDKRSFYFINSQKRYGRGTIEIWADYREEIVLVIFSVCWNPDGSRNLEPKPE